ncbi:uncharacterized protein BcabD6B2_36670 [Babesia caballi]|uniref:Transmembrane protein, putative n=1 Tax=Babesia caballi TaxID=5871 RepID=A0AAV4LWP3_BABCB|nr:transmembrane protein, putative [Babesia caballi]
MPEQGNNRRRENHSARVHREAHSQSSRAADSICAVSCTTSIENQAFHCHDTDEKTVAGHEVTAVRDTNMSSARPHAGCGLDDIARIKGHFDQHMPFNTLESMANPKHYSNDTVDPLPPFKEAVNYGGSSYNSRIARHKGKYVADANTADFIGDGQCISTFYTTISMGGMLLALLVPAVFHICFQFRLYGGLFSIPEHIKNADGIQSRRMSIMKDTWAVVDHLGEFENFFFIGVFLYLSIQIVGFYTTQARIRRYLWKLCSVAVEMSKHEFLYGSKQRAMEHFSDYAKRMYRNQAHACTQTEQGLVKAFDEASSKFDNYQIESIWRKTSFMRYRILFTRIHLPMLLNFVISIGMTAFVYDKRFRMHHRVPLAHPDIVSNLYWYAAIQYEGFWCIFALFLLNFATWLYLCHTNFHTTMFGLLEGAHNHIHAVASDYGSKLAKDVWDKQMLLFSSTIYAIDSNKVNRGVSYAPARLETLNSQINFGNTIPHKDKRPCLCQFLCIPTLDQDSQDAPHFVNGSPFEELHIPLLETESRSKYRTRNGPILHE